jgi:hypothetical protein
MSNILVCSATKGKKEDTALFKSSKKLLDQYFLHFKFKENNSEPLQSYYNKCIQEAKNYKYDFLVLIHDDVYINCSDLWDRIQNNCVYTVNGLAGSRGCNLKEPALWHLMSDRKDHRGCVAHGSEDQYMYTSFGPLPSRALLIDGLFICINIKQLPDEVRFDETCPSKFHFYDLDICLTCNEHKVSVGVVDIPVIHQSPGLDKPDETFYNGQRWFLNKWKNKD